MLFAVLLIEFMTSYISGCCGLPYFYWLIFPPYPASGVQSLSSSVQSTPEKTGHSDDASKSPELLQEFLKSGRKELFRTCAGKEKLHSASSRCKMAEPHSKLSKKALKNQDPKKASLSPNCQPSRKQNRKSENPIRVPPSTEPCAITRCSNSWICKNSACRAVLSIDDTFCKRCSCCICHLFDDNKDPSLWLECTSEPGRGESCGLSCHVECALQRGKVGVVDVGQLMQLDGSYCCASCGKVSGMIGFWKKQLTIAKDARRVDILCYRIYLNYRLLDGTSRFKELHKIIEEAKVKLETEVGPLSEVSSKMARGIVSRLSVAADVQALCSLAIEKADEWSATSSSVNPDCKEGSLPAACKFLFEEVTSSSVVIVLIELTSSSSDDITGYKLWYCNTRDETHSKEPVSVFPRSQRRILISNLQPCTEYSFRIVSFTENGDLGHSEAKCFTQSVELIHKNPNSVNGCREKIPLREGSSGAKKEVLLKNSKDVESDSGFKVRDLGKILQLAWAQERGCLDGFCGADLRKCCGATSQTNKTETSVQVDKAPSTSRGLDLNVASVPDLNEEVVPPRDEDNGCTGPTVEADDLARSHGSNESENWAHGAIIEVPAVDSRTELSRKRPASTELDCNSTLINGSQVETRGSSGSLDGNFENCVKIIRWLETEGYIKQEFRLKLLTWFSLRSTEQERRVVSTFIRTLIDDPSSLAGQLVDSFSDMVSSKRPRNGFCSKLWH